MLNMHVSLNDSRVLLITAKCFGSVAVYITQVNTFPPSCHVNSTF